MKLQATNPAADPSSSNQNSNGEIPSARDAAGEYTRGSPQAKLAEKLTNLLETLGYDLVHLEMQLHHGKVLRIYIDRLGGTGNANVEAIGVEDCVKVTKALDEPLDAMPELDAAFGGAYELEVSSPGVDRPLRKLNDFERFNGRDARIHTFRPLTEEEIGNADYLKRNPKQKNFLGILSGIQKNSAGGPDGAIYVKLTVLASMGVSVKGKKPKQKENEKKDDILVPVNLIAKANIEPDFDFSS